MDTNTLFVTYVTVGLLYCVLPLRHNIVLRMLYFVIMCMNMLLVTFAILQHSDARHDNHYDDEMGGIYISIGWVMAIAILVAFFTLPINRHSGVLRMLHLVILLVASAGVAGVVRSRIVVLNVMDARELLTIADICNDTMIRCIV